MTYEELCVAIMDAKEELERAGGKAEVIRLSPTAFNILAEKSPNRPTMLGMEIEMSNWYLGTDPVFAVRERNDLEKFPVLNFKVEQAGSIEIPKLRITPREAGE